ncbi:MAG: MBL fold metallo-hydrolase [Candidatus Liptonbacteria bacterium]
MVIQYFGEECFRLQSGELSILVNPSSNRLKGDVVLKTIAATDAVPEQDEFIFPGEYETRGIEMHGFQVEQESTATFVKTVFEVIWEGMKFVFLGHISKSIEGEWLDNLAEPDILFVPTGDSHFIDPHEAAKLIKQIEPAVIIPSYRKKPEEFLKAMGEKGEALERLVIKKKDLLDKKLQVIVLETK